MINDIYTSKIIEKIFNKLIEFIQYMEINDLHKGNIGYINLKPVLMDYSGWND